MRTGEGRGWDAIDAALAPVVGRTVPQHWDNAAARKGELGLWGVSAYPLGGHWLFVTYGLTELFAKASGDPGISGWGEELTMRVVRAEGTPVPRWPVRLLGLLGKEIFRRSDPFLPGGRMLVPGAADGAPPALCWALDPLLRPVEGPFGRFIFATTIGIATSVYEAMNATSTTEEHLEPIQARNPLLISGGPGLTW
jgi:suppressor of fused-like protein